MESYDADVLKEMKSKVNLLDYASQSMEFKHRGNGLYATNCPLHIDKTPSLMIYSDQNAFHCFSCGASGDIYTWLQTFEKLSFAEAVKKVAEITGTDMSNSKPCQTIAIFKKMKQLKEMNDEKISQRQILSENYLKNFAEEIPREWVEEGIDPEVMKRYGIRIDVRGNRIVYPVYDGDGNLIAVKGRTRYKNFQDIGLQKYKFYQKIGTLDFFVGWQEALPYIQKRNEVYLFEGIKSVMKVAAWGYENSMSCETSHISDGQIKWLLKHKIKNIIICFDSDREIKKIKENVKMLRRFTNVYVVIDKNKLLGGKDAKASPCDKGCEVFEQLLKDKVKI